MTTNSAITDPSARADAGDLPQAIPATMRALTRRRYGDVGVLRLEQLPVPQPATGEVLVRVHAAAVHRGDVHLMTGRPHLVRMVFGLLRPRQPVLGQEAAGTVVAVGDGVEDLRVGDAVFGPVGSAAFAEYVRAPADRLARKPAGLTFAQAAAIGDSAMTALQAVRDHARVRAGQRLLVNGAAGGVGTFAVQIAKALGAHVTAVCSSSRVDQIRALGADRVVDYTRQDFVQLAASGESGGEPFDAIVDLVGNRSLRECQRVLTANGTLVAAAGGTMGDWFGPLVWLAKFRVANCFARRTLRTMLVDVNARDLAVLRELVVNGDVAPVIERVVAFEHAPTAIGHVAGGHAFGKTILDVVGRTGRGGFAVE